MIEDFLPNQLTSRSQSVARITSSQHLSAAAMALSFAVCCLPWTGRVGKSPSGVKNDAGPVLPGGIDLLGLGQPKEMTFGCKDLSEPHTKGRAEIPRLAAFSAMIKVAMVRAESMKAQTSAKRRTNKERIGKLARIGIKKY